LREQGGILIQKKCLQENEETGHCELWEKTYDIGKIRKNQTAYTFEEGKKIWGLKDEFSEKEKANSKDRDFQQAIGGMRVFSDMPKGETTSVIINLSDKSQIFNGVKHTCNCDHVLNEWDCCEHMKKPMSECDEQEKELRKLRDEGRCKKIGSYREGWFGHDKTKVFCCYPTKLLRIFNEKARDTMWGKDTKAKWGTPKAPKCHGFSIEAMEGMVDLSTIDLSEAADEFDSDEDAVTQEIQDKIRTLLKDPKSKNIFQEALHAPQ
jgi:hypothetical protein